MALIPRWGRCPGEGNGNPLQYSCLGNPVDGGVWRASVHGVEKSWIRPSNWTATACNGFIWLQYSAVQCTFKFVHPFMFWILVHLTPYGFLLWVSKCYRPRTHEAGGHICVLTVNICVWKQSICAFFFHVHDLNCRELAWGIPPVTRSWGRDLMCKVKSDLRFSPWYFLSMYPPK